MTVIRSSSAPRAPGPAWEVAHLYPPQGQWRESDYLEITQNSNRLAELTDGCLTVLSMLTTTHQLIVQYLVLSLLEFITPRRLGTALSAPLRVRLWTNTFREPDIVFMRADHAGRIGEDYWDGADLVMEVVSGSAKDRRRDRIDKRREYALAGIGEYWSVDPGLKRITVLRRRQRAYVTHIEAGPGEVASSVLLRGFHVAVNDVLAAGKRA